MGKLARSLMKMIAQFSD